MDVFSVNKDLFLSDPALSRMINGMREEAVEFAKNFKDDPKNLSEWGHNYFCATDGERLIFDLNKPKEHVCQLCGTKYSTKTFDNVWTYFYRNTAIITLMKLAVLYKVEGKQEYLDEYKKILSFYADHYTEFDLHAKDKIVEDLTVDVGGAARLMPQGLNEAIVIIRIIISLEILKDDIDAEFVERVTKGLFDNAVKVLRPQIIRIHNIPCWLNSALGVIALYTKNEELKDFVFNGEFGVNNQLKQGVTDDKFWYEGSIHYNFFLLEGVTYLLAFCKIYDQKLECESIVKEMLESAYHYAFDNDILPNPNDGWPNVTLKSYEYIYCLGSKIFGEGNVTEIYKHILANENPRVEFPLSKPYYFNNEISFEKLTCHPDIDVAGRTEIPRGSKVFKASHFGMLKNQNINVFMKYGHNGPSHAHPDKMNIEIMVKGKSLSRDLSNTGYASKLCNEWHRKSISHNTILVDGLNHVSMEGGTVLEFNDNTCHAKVDNVYEGVNYERKVVISENGFTDDFKVTSSAQHNYDFIFHSEAELVTKLDTTPAEIGYSAEGYEHLKDVQKVNVSGDSIVLEWKLGDTKLESEIFVNGSEMFIADTYDNPVSRFRKAFILRDKTTAKEYKVNWKICN